MRIVVILLAIILAVGILSTIGYVGFKTIDYMISQGFEFGDALYWAWDDYTDLAWKNIFGKVKAENQNFLGYDNVNRNVSYSGPYTY